LCAGATNNQQTASFRISLAARRSSNSTCSICCGFVVQQVVQQVHNKFTITPQLFDKSRANPHHLNMSRCCGFVVDSTTKSITNRINGVWLSTYPHKVEKLYNNSQLIHNITSSRATCCTSNPQRSHTNRMSGV
jgi:hypothetical protein